MALDGLVLYALHTELTELIGGKVNRIHQPNEYDLLLQVRNKGANYRLLISAHPTYPRIHLTSETQENPMDPPTFCRLARKYCEMGSIESITQDGLDRILTLVIKKRNELGDYASKNLIFELTGRHSNLILVDEAGTVIDGIRHVTPQHSQYRVILPGSTYKAPPSQERLDPRYCSEETLKEILNQEEQVSEKTITQNFQGISSILAREIIYRTKNSDTWTAWNEIFNEPFQPHIVQTKDQKNYFSCVALSHIEGQVETFQSISRCVEIFYQRTYQQIIWHQTTATLFQLLNSELQKNKKKIDNLYADLKKSDQVEELRIKGELLFSQLHTLPKKDHRVQVINYYDEAAPTLEIELNPRYSLSENAQIYLKKYKKIKKSKNHIIEQLKITNEEVIYLENLIQSLKMSSSKDVGEIKEELVEQGYLKKQLQKKGNRKKVSIPKVEFFYSSTGVRIYVGKNNIQNEYLTNKLAKYDELWLHTKDIPGSHVVIKDKSPDEVTLREAAEIAAYFSQARQSSNVPVDYTFIRHVRKPTGAKPGFVIYDHQKTIYVTPSEQKIEALKNNLPND